MEYDKNDPRVLKDREMTQAEGRMAREADVNCGSSPILGGSQGSVSRPIGTADQEAKRHLENLIQVKRKRLESAQQDATEMFYLQSLLDSLPTKLTHEAAMGLNVLTRIYGNSPARY